MLFPKVPGGFFTLLALACVPWCLRIDPLSGWWTLNVFQFGTNIGLLLIIAGADWYGRKHLRATPSTDHRVKAAIKCIFGIALLIIGITALAPTSELVYWLDLALRGIGIVIGVIASALNGSTINFTKSP